MLDLFEAKGYCRILLKIVYASAQQQNSLNPECNYALETIQENNTATRIDTKQQVKIKQMIEKEI